MSMLILASLTVLISITTIIGSALSAELLTNFDIEHRVIEPGQNIVTVENTGLIQANDVILQIGANGTIDGYVDECVEGDIEELLGNSKIVMKFSRMSPGSECNIGLTVSERVYLNMVVSSDGRLTEWRSWEKWSNLNNVRIIWSTVFVSEIIFIVVVAFRHLLPRSEWLNYWEFKQREKRLANKSEDGFDVASKADEIKKFVQKEYGLDVNEIDATILELIYFQKTTMPQLQRHSKLSLQQVKYRVRKLRRHELISKEKIELHAALGDFFDQLWQDAYRDWKTAQARQFNRLPRR